MIRKPAGLQPQEACGASPRGKKATQKLSPYVRVVNSVWNGTGLVKRKVAERYIADGRGNYVDDGKEQMLLAMTHPANLAAARQAAVGYNVNAGFEWRARASGGATVMMTESRTR